MAKPCPCCGYLTIDSEDEIIFDICEVCYWQYDEVSHLKPNSISGANGASLFRAKENFKNLGACDAKFIGCIRPPREDEIPKYE